MLSIYNYSEFHKYMQDAWRDKKAKNKAFSMSAWAKQLGLENSSPLSLAFKGHRALPKKYLPQVVQSLNLSSKEAQYLEALLDLSIAKTPQQKLLYLARLKELSPSSQLQSSLVEEFKYLSDPLHTALIEMTDLKDFRPDPLWIKGQLGFKVRLETIREALQRLQELHLLTPTSEAKSLKKTHKNLTSEDDVSDLASKNYHRAVCRLAGIAVFEQVVNEREFQSYSFNMEKSKMPQAKKKIREFLNEFFNEFGAPAGSGDITYQMNLQLFKVTK